MALLLLTLASCGGDPTTDETAPAAVLDLAVDSISSGGMFLSWTASGDDEEEGTAATYQLRYGTTSTILTADWDNATAATSLPEPAVSGEIEAYHLTGLDPGVNYHIGLKVVDEANNVSSLSNIVSAPTPSATDELSPAAVVDLGVDSVTYNAAFLSWTASGDDGLKGTATTYQMRYGTDSANLVNDWNSATVATMLPTPAMSGMTETYQLNELTSGDTYYAALKVLDEAANVSDLSNIVSASIPIPNLTTRLFLPDLQTSDCDLIAVPVTVQNFEAVSGIELRIAYDTLETIFDSLRSDHISTDYVNDSDGVIRFIWADLNQNNPVSLNDNDTLLSLFFSGLTDTSALVFEEPIYITDTSSVHLPVEITDGSITCTGN